MPPIKDNGRRHWSWTLWHLAKYFVTSILKHYLTLKYRINGGVGIIGGLEMVRDNNNRGVGIIGGGGCLEK